MNAVLALQRVRMLQDSELCSQGRFLLMFEGDKGCEDPSSYPRSIFGLFLRRGEDLGKDHFFG
jgi:hypothetical protein